jgi:hypothetical protein
VPREKRAQKPVEKGTDALRQPQEKGGHSASGERRSETAARPRRQRREPSSISTTEETQCKQGVGSEIRAGPRAAHRERKRDLQRPSASREGGRGAATGRQNSDEMRRRRRE